MKKIKISIIIFILLMFFIPKAYAKTYKFFWYNTCVEVPVGASIEAYKNQPYAKLKVNGIFVRDAVITYSTVGDWLYFFEDIDTTKIGDYYVWYKAYENTKYNPGTCTDYKCLINFKVVDKIKPTISIVKDKISVAKGTTDYDLKNNIIVKDNYDENPEISLSEVDFNTAGVYLVNVKVIDSSQNEANATFEVEVYDIAPPKIIIYNKTVTLFLSETTYDPANNFTIQNYTEFSVDGDKNIVYGSIGEYKITVSATNDSGVSVTDDFIVEIIDNSEVPIITFSGVGNMIEIPINKAFDIKKYFTANDSIQGDITNNIYFPTFNNSTLGSFEYIVSVINNYDKTATYTITIKVVDVDTPSITLTTNSLTLDYETNFNTFNFDSYVMKITDDSEIINTNLTHETNLVNKVGVYYIRYYYTDGLHSCEDVINVRLVSYKRPVIETSYIEIVEDSVYDLKDYIVVSDDSDTAILRSLEIDDSNVIYDEPGTYYLTAYVLNSSGLSTEKKIRVKVTDSGIDTITLIFIISSSVLLAIVIAITIIGIFLYKKMKRHSYN